MAIDIDRDNARLTRAAAEILRRHDNGEAEANITSAARDFLVMTGLARRDQIVEENPPPEFDAENPSHRAVSEAGKAASSGAARELKRLRQERERLTATIARRELRTWLRESDEGLAVEDAVIELLGG